MVITPAMSLIDVKVASRLPPSSDLSGSTALRELLRRIEMKLPAELQSLIFIYISGLFRGLSDAFLTLQEIQFHKTTREPCRVSSQPFLGSGVLASIGLDTVGLFGETYLKRVGDPNSRISFDHEVLVCPRRAFRGLQVAIGTYGVTDLRIIYHDCSFSPWGGNLGHKWVTTYLGPDLRHLRVVSDVSSRSQTLVDPITDPLQKGLRIIHVDLGSDPGPSPSHGLTRAFWNHERPPLNDTESSYIDLTQSGGTVRANQRVEINSRMTRALSLENIHSLTMFFNARGTCCIQVNGDLMTRIGIPSYDICSTTYFLLPGESIESLQVFTQGGPPPMDIVPWFGPYLSVSLRVIYTGTGSDECRFGRLGVETSITVLVSSLRCQILICRILALMLSSWLSCSMIP